jgi:hypothetical protein
MSKEQGEPNDNPSAIDPSGSVNFPRPLINPYGNIQRSNASPSQFVLPANGVFEITFQVGVQNTGELVVVLNGEEQLMTIVGKPGAGEVIGMCIIATPPSIQSILSINNPSSADNGGLHIDAASGALTKPLSCHLIIKQLA